MVSDSIDRAFEQFLKRGNVSRNVELLDHGPSWMSPDAVWNDIAKVAFGVDSQVNRRKVCMRWRNMQQQHRQALIQLCVNHGMTDHIERLVPITETRSKSVAAFKTGPAIHGSSVTVVSEEKSSNSSAKQNYVSRGERMALLASRSKHAVKSTPNNKTVPFLSVTQEVDNPPATSVDEQGTSIEQPEVAGSSLLIDDATVHPTCSVVTDKQVQSKYKKPLRCCPFCGVPQSRLARHIVKKHQTDKSVVDALQLSKTERAKTFATFRKMGILNDNKAKMADGVKELQGERKARSAQHLVMCNSCNGFYAKAQFRRHTAKCKQEDGGRRGLPAVLLREPDVENDTFLKEVITRFADDDVGNLCRTDPFLRSFGKCEFAKVNRKQEKKVEVRRSTMRDMRRLAKLFIAFRTFAAVDEVVVTMQDMLERRYFKYLTKAIENITKSEDSIKSGLTLGLGYLIKRAADVAKAEYLMMEKDDKAQAVDNFLAVFKIQWPVIFGAAEYSVVINRQERLRRPAQLPMEEDVAKLRQYTVTSLSRMNDQYTFIGQSEFREMRDVVVVRLTMFNARRGGEPCRLSVREWFAARNGEWVDQSAVNLIKDPAEAALLGKYKLAYQAGKGNHHLVPVLIPLDCVAVIEKLADPAVRDAVGIRTTNKFLFPYLQGSDDHVIGWHAVKTVCTLAGVTARLNADVMRHRASTIYASLEVPESERQVFYEHMGHSKDINKNVYQCPSAIAAVTKVGKYFDKLDQACTTDGDGPTTSGVTEKHFSGHDSDHNVGSVMSDSDRDDSDVDPTWRLEENVSSEDSGNTGLQHENEDNEAQPPVVEKKRRTYTQWTGSATAIVNTYFARYVKFPGSGCTGPLPAKDELCRFLDEHPDVLDDVSDSKKRLQLLRTKIFNERKLLRAKTERELSKMRR